MLCLRKKERCVSYSSQSFTINLRFSWCFFFFFSRCRYNQAAAFLLHRLKAPLPEHWASLCPFQRVTLHIAYWTLDYCLYPTQPDLFSCHGQPEPVFSLFVTLKTACWFFFPACSWKWTEIILQSCCSWVSLISCHSSKLLESMCRTL